MITQGTVDGEDSLFDEAGRFARLPKRCLVRWTVMHGLVDVIDRDTGSSVELYWHDFAPGMVVIRHRGISGEAFSVGGFGPPHS